MLIKKGASPYLKNNEGKTALDIAREAHQQGNVECLKKSKPKKKVTRQPQAFSESLKKG